MEKIITERELLQIAELSKLKIDNSKSDELIRDLEKMIEFAEKISLADLSVKEKELMTV